MKLKAFTLAEALITMTILGVVAALTVPPLLNTYMHRVCADQLKRVVGEINTAASTVITEENAAEAANEDAPDAQPGFYVTRAGSRTSNQNEGAQYFLNNFIRHNIAGRELTFVNQYKNSAGREIGTIPLDYTDCVQTQTNASICMHYNDASNLQRIFVDVNGKQRPNVIGVDLFVMQITNTGSVADITPANANNCGIGNDVTTATSGCLQRVIDNGWRIE